MRERHNAVLQRLVKAIPESLGEKFAEQKIKDTQVLIIGASLSEPHTSGETGRIFYYIYIYILYIYCTYVVLYIRDSHVLI